MSEIDDFYNERVERVEEIDSVDNKYQKVFDELSQDIDFDKSIINIAGPIIHGETLLNVSTKIRAILKLRPNPEAPINVLINSNGGDKYEALGIVDFIKSLDVPVNTICRGIVNGEALELFASATGARFMSKRAKLGAMNSSEALKASAIDHIIEDYKLPTKPKT